jgi:mannosyl-oligosaccharide alpha-1,2-mannosidase
LVDGEFTDIDHVNPPKPTITQVQNAPIPISSTAIATPSPPSISVQAKAEAVKAEFLHAWNGYKTFAWGHDELKPITKTFKDWIPGGMGLTILDSLDTLLLMDLTDDYQKAKDWVTNSADFNKNFGTSVFETTIRVVGGLLSAYEISKDKILLDKAVDMGDRLYKAFDSQTGIPYTTVNLHTGVRENPPWNGRASTLSEFGTIQLEFRKLSQLTGDRKYIDAAVRIDEFVQSHPPRSDGLFPCFINPETGAWMGDHITLGALGDSFYEYLLKQWIMTKEPKYRMWYEKAVEGIIAKMVFKSADHTFLAELEGNAQIHKMDHLACFAGGMLALGAQGATKERDIRLGAEITETCYKMYKNSPIGLSPETIQFHAGGFNMGVPYYIQRPEAVESLFVLYRVTGDTKYQDWAWEIFENIKRNCRVDNGYTGLRSIHDVNSKDDFQQSFFLAETLKYLYLIFTDKVDLNKWVINTEAHPLRVIVQ